MSQIVKFIRTPTSSNRHIMRFTALIWTPQWRSSTCSWSRKDYEDDHVIYNIIERQYGLQVIYIEFWSLSLIPITSILYFASVVGRITVDSDLSRFWVDLACFANWCDLMWFVLSIVMINLILSWFEILQNDFFDSDQLMCNSRQFIFHKTKSYANQIIDQIKLHSSTFTCRLPQMFI